MEYGLISVWIPIKCVQSRAGRGGRATPTRAADKFLGVQKGKGAPN